jgi:hypothetical protein
VAIVIGQLGPGWPGAGDAGRRRIGRGRPGLGRDSAESRGRTGLQRLEPEVQVGAACLRGLCTGPVLRRAGKKAARFIDNGWYAGHDGPSVKLISNAAGSGNTMTFFMKRSATRCPG